MESKLKIGGVFTFECYDKDGKLKWKDTAKNAVVTEGLNHILDVEFHGTAAAATWYIGLIKTAYTGNAADTLGSHAGWTEAVATTDYTGARPAWTEGATAAGVITNAATVDFACLTSITLKGAFLASTTDNTGKLFCTAAFTGGDQAVNNGDTVKVTYTITASAA